MSQTPATMIEAREQFLAMVASVRPELHRYCARLTGSVIDGEDIVQDTLAKAFYALTQTPEVPPLRPWLFRIAHNAAIDSLRAHGRKQTDLVAEIEEIADTVTFDDARDPTVVRAALDGAEAPSYFILLTFEDGKVSAIRDYRYVPYIAAEAQIEER